MASILLCHLDMGLRFWLLKLPLFLGAAAVAVWVLSPGDPSYHARAADPAPVLTPDAPSVFAAPQALPPQEGVLPGLPPSSAGAAPLNPWELAILKVEEVRGSAGRIEVPEELQHASDRRRFLAVQMADASDNGYQIPHDSASLADMILRGELVEVPALSQDYVLYELGEDAGDDPMQHYDADTGKDVPLFSPDEWRQESARLAALAEKGPGAAEARARRDFLVTYYEDSRRREPLFREREAVRRLSNDFGGVSYDLSLPSERARFKVRLLSFVRPDARDVIVQLARSYRERFDRPLPVTSLMRTERYQRRLGRVNRNATTVEQPPHTTGMAFDISYKFMPPDEQNFVMQEVARLDGAGRVEALRERRNHIHVYALHGGRPSELRVAHFLPIVEAAHPGSAPRRVADRPARPAAKPSRRSSSRRAR